MGPGETLVLEVDFESRLPRGLLRTGWKDDFVFAGQWFPKLAEATEAGWRGRPFHAATEFFADFGDYDVTLLLPGEVKGKVAVTGRVLEEADEGAGRVRVRARAEDVHDFAFAFSPRFEVERETVAPKGLPKVDVLLFLQPDHRALARALPPRGARGARPLRHVAGALPVPGPDDRRPAHGLAARRRWSTRRSSPAGRRGSPPPREASRARSRSTSSRTSGSRGCSPPTR